MRKIILISVLLLLIGMLFVSGCFYKNIYSKKYYECDDGTKVLDKSQCDALEELRNIQEKLNDQEYEPVAPVDESDDVESEVIPVTSLSDEAKNLFSKFDKVKTIQFGYVYSVNLPDKIYFVSKEKMKINLKARLGNVDKFDNVYLDLVNHEAVAYCENRDLELCPDRNKEIEVEYDDFIIETPFDWVASIENARLTGKSKTLENRNALEVEFTRNGKKGIMFVDSFFALPLYITFGDRVYEFRDVVVNEATDKDLKHQIVE